MKHSKKIALGIAAATVSLLMIGAGSADPDEKVILDGSSRKQVADHFTIEQGAEEKHYLIAGNMSDEKLEKEVRLLYLHWQEEERWASFLQYLMLHQKEHDESSYLVWQKNWSDLTGGLWVYSNMHGFRARQLLDKGEYDKFMYQDVYASLAVMLPKIRDAREILAQGIMTDVLKPGNAKMFLDPWTFDLKPD